MLRVKRKILDQTVPFNEGVKTREQKEEENLSGWGVVDIHMPLITSTLLSPRFGNFALISNMPVPGIDLALHHAAGQATRHSRLNFIAFTMCFRVHDAVGN